MLSTMLDVPAALPAGPLPTNSINPFQLILHASLPVQLVMAILLVVSVMSWAIIFRKRAQLGAAEREAANFEERFWSGAQLGDLHDRAGKTGGIGGMEAIVDAGMREFHRVTQMRGADSRLQLEGAQRAMRASTARELDSLEHNLEFLANTGSISPYIGLFGTVWGIMISFQGLASLKQATIATVAPGISEALIATAMGLFAAIPAVWAYNRLATRVDRLASRYDAFSEEFASILQRWSPLPDAR